MLTIGKVAEKAGVSRDTIRYYEKLGLLPRAVRTSAGYRVFPDGVLRRLSLIRNGRRFGFSLNQLAEFLRSRERGTPPCHDVRAAGQRMLAKMNEQIAQFLVVRDALISTLGDWDERLSGRRRNSPAGLLESLPDDFPSAPRPTLEPWRRRSS
jgi:MerR family copper efflux transcriptional regulator